MIMVSSVQGSRQSGRLRASEGLAAAAGCASWACAQAPFMSGGDRYMWRAIRPPITPPAVPEPQVCNSAAVQQLCNSAPTPQLCPHQLCPRAAAPPFQWPPLLSRPLHAPPWRWYEMSLVMRWLSEGGVAGLSRAFSFTTISRTTSDSWARGRGGVACGGCGVHGGWCGVWGEGRVCVWGGMCGGREAEGGRGSHQRARARQPADRRRQRRLPEESSLSLLPLRHSAKCCSPL